MEGFVKAVLSQKFKRQVDLGIQKWRERPSKIEQYM
jgi:hypothetical protein